MAALSWAFYSIIVKKLNDKYPALMVTRKTFFYGILTLLPYFIFDPSKLNLEILSRSSVYSNLIFLGFLASMICFFVWNIVIKNIGTVSATNYIYLGPLITMTSGYIFLGETVTAIAVLGAMFIILGVYIAERGFDITFFSRILKKL